MVRARAESVQPNLAKIGDRRGSSAEVLRCLRPKVRGHDSTTFGFIPWHSPPSVSAARLVSAPTRAG